MYIESSVTTTRICYVKHRRTKVAALTGQDKEGLTHVGTVSQEERLVTLCVVITLVKLHNDQQCDCCAVCQYQTTTYLFLQQVKTCEMCVNNTFTIGLLL